MALNPNYLDSLPNTLVDLYSLVEIDILEDMARRISTYDFFIPAAMHQNQKLQELGMTQQHIIEALAGMTGQTQQEIVDLLTEAGEMAIADDVEYYKAAEVYEPTEINSEALHKQLNSGLLQTQQAFKNITATTANTATKQFENALDRAWTQINVGGMDYNTAIHRAIKDLSEAGVGAIAYKSGRVDSLEVAVRRAVVTGANQTAAKTQEALADELGVDLVEVTAHGGARPEHAKWQGKCYSRKGRKVIDGVVYEDFETATRYGHGDGLGGWNCRHNFHPYVHGAPRTWSDKALKDLDKKDIEYNGVKYTEYEASQIQRKIERDIRSLKRQVAALEAGGGDASAERAKLRKANKAYTDFTEQTGLKKQTARTKIATGTGTERPAPNEPTPPPVATKPKKQEFTPAKSIEEAEKHIEKHAKNVSFSGAKNIDAVNAVNERLSTLTTKYPIRQLNIISTNSELGRTAAQANHESLEISTRFLNKLPKAIDWEKRIEKNPMHIEKYKEQMMKVPKSERGKYERIIREHEKEMLFNRWTVSEGKSGLEQIAATITHEYGHIIADQYIGQVTRKAANPRFDWDNSNPLKAMQNKIVATHQKTKQNGDIYKMSMYADENEYEFFAEAFAMYELGETLPDYVKDMVEEVLSFGTMQ